MTLSFFHRLLACSGLLFPLASLAAPMSIDELLASPPNPLVLQASLQPNSATQLITTAAGGQIYLKSSDGSEYILTFPAKSVPYDMTITMTETKDLKLNNLSIESFGVQLFPDGLQLNQPASLEIKASRAMNTRHLSLMTSQNDGHRAHAPALQELSAQSVKLKLFHFSNYAASDDERVQEIIDMGMADTESIRLNNWFNRQTLKHRKAALLDEPTLPENEFTKMYLDALKEVVKKVVIPKLQKAVTCQGGNEALSSYYLVSRNAQLQGISLDQVLEADEVAAYQDARALTTSLCLKEARQLCHVEHKIPEAADIWLKLSRVAALSDDEPLSAAVDEAANKCMKFKFFMQTDFKLGEGAEEFHGLVAVSEFDFQFTLAATFVTASGMPGGPAHDFQKGTINIIETYLNIEDLVCTRTSMVATPGPIQIDNFIADMIAGRKPTLRLADPSPEVKAQFLCRDQNHSFTMPYPPTGAEGYFLGLYHAVHGPEGLDEMNADGYFDLKNAVFNSGSRYIEAVYNHTVEEVVHEETSIVVYHTPED